jgi:hypothetical protein
MDKAQHGDLEKIAIDEGRSSFKEPYLRDLVSMDTYQLGELAKRLGAEESKKKM